MQLIGALASGIRGAENGTVEFLQRGTSTHATYYTDFEATTAVTPSGTVTLDANGGLVAYVLGPTNCIVRDSSGNVVRTFVAGEASASVEVISQSFTGVNYGSGASGVSNPVALATVLDLWKTSAGAIDWNVLVNGSSRSLQSALSALAGLFFSVKDPLYGAKGDGATNDAANVQACLTACGNAGGGIVFFPAGSYLCAAQLTIPANVSLLGTGAASSKLYANGAAQVLGLFSAAGGSWQSVSGLSLLNNQANSQPLLKSTSALKLTVERCVVGDAFTDSAGLLFTTSAAQYIHVKDCVLVSGDSACTPVQCSLGELLVDGCVISPNAVQNAYLIFCGGKRASVNRCFFDNSTATSGTFTDIQFECTSGPAVACDCEFSNGAGANVTALTSLATTDRVIDRGNVFGSSVAAYAFTGGALGTTREGCSLLSRDTRQILYSTDANVTVRPDQYGHILVTRGAGFAAATTMTLAAPGAPGMRASIVYRNSNGGGATGLVTVTTVKGLANFTVNASSATLYTLESEEAAGNLNWVLVSTTANYVP